MTNGNNNDESRKDLTRIEDLSEFLHVEDSEVENLFGDFEKKSSNLSDDKSAIHDEILSELSLPEGILGEIHAEVAGEIQEETEFETEEFSSALDGEDNFETEFITESESDSTFNFETSNESSDLLENISFDENFTDSTSIDESPFELSEKEENKAPEKFEDIQNFSENFTYGQILGGGNPPFSLIIKNLKYSDDAQDILIILRDFGLITEQNENDMIRSLEIGSTLIPQISEYSAIILAHKLRRFDCDLEVGLSDEVHPSKSGDENPRGLIKKESLKQNISQSYQKNNHNISVHDIIVSTTEMLEGHIIEKYLGVHSSFTIVDEDELERLQFVQQSVRMNSFLGDENSELAYNNYQKSFELLFIDLCDQLKVKAITEKANALLGVNYQLTTMPFEKTNMGKNCYQLTCTATFVIVSATSEK
ncbi:MAG: hypothetical protein Q7U04_11840 [Bacteriovorax sp.]|nr:hypothetical protein [Bacteriovorax sp.]